MDNKVTTIEELLEYQKGQFVQLPDFAEGMPFFARLKRPSLLALARNGKIPNSLIHTANQLFYGKGTDVKDDNVMPDLLSLLDVICEATFVEPSYPALKEAGVELTDDQLMFVFQYTQQGVKALEPFRKESAGPGPLSNVSAVSNSAL